MSLRIAAFIALWPALASAAEPRAFTTVAVLHDEQAFNGAHDVELQGDLAYVCGKGGSLAIVNVAEPAKPHIVWSRRDVDFLGDAETVLPAGDVLFLGTQDFHTLDVRNPSMPEFVAAIKDRPTIDRINGFVRDGNHVFAANKEGWIDVFDVTIPADPKLATVRNAAEADGVGKPHDVDFCRGRIVVVDPAGFGRHDVGGTVAFYRTHDPRCALLPGEQWTLVGKVTDERLVGGNRVRGYGDFVIVAASISPQAIAKAGRIPCVTIVDAADQMNPQVVSVVPFPDVRGPNGMDVVGSIVFASGGQTVMAVDVRNPRRPTLLAAEKCLDIFHGEPGRDDGHDLAYRDGYLYVTGQTSHTFGVLRVDDPRIREAAASP